MAKIDWGYARDADIWTLEEFREFVCPDDSSDEAKLDRLARRAIDAGTLRPPKRFRHPRFHPGIYGETPQRKNDIIYLIPAEAIAWAQTKGFTIPPELAGIESPRPADETLPSTTNAADNEPIAKRKAPDRFIAALIRLLVEISKRAAQKGKPFNVTEMPGRKADFRALAIKFDDELDQKTPRTFNDYLSGLVQFKQGAQETTYYQELFPEFFAPRRSDP